MAIPVTADDFRERFPPEAHSEFKEAALDETIEMQLALAREYVDAMQPPIVLPLAREWAVAYFAAHHLTREAASQSRSQSPTSVAQSRGGVPTIAMQSELQLTTYGRRFLSLTKGSEFRVKGGASLNVGGVFR